MSPPCGVFKSADLPYAIQVDVNGKRRKPAAHDGGSGRIDLSACELLSMLQYDCQVENPRDMQETVKCWPVQRWFRRYVFLCLCFCFSLWLPLGAVMRWASSLRVLSLFFWVQARGD